MPEATQNPTPASEGTDLGDEYIFYDRGGDRVHVLNGTAREIFLLCDGTRTEEEIVEAFTAKFDVEKATARQDTLETLGQLRQLGLLKA